MEVVVEIEPWTIGRKERRWKRRKLSPPSFLRGRRSIQANGWRTEPIMAEAPNRQTAF